MVSNSCELNAAIKRHTYTKEKCEMGKNHPYSKGQKGNTNAPAEPKKVVEYAVDGSANPRVPLGLKLGTHARTGTAKLTLAENELYVNGKKVVLVPCDDSHGIMLSAEAMTKKLDDMGLRPLNANFRDFLVENIGLIPSAWKVKSVFFPSTTFIAPNNDPCIPFIYWIKGWSWHNRPFSGGTKDVFGKDACIACI